jgi:hypothetical protein
LADNILATPGVGATLAADNIGGVLFPRSKLVYGAAGVNAGDVSLANGLPVQPQTGAMFRVDNGGTFATQAAQSGTWTVQPGNTANTTAWLVTGTGGTFPVTDSGGSLTVDNGGTFAVQAAQAGTWNLANISGTVSLPTGAATAAKQPALGTAGTASADVLTVQGVASMTALKVDGSAVTQPVSGTFWQATLAVRKDVAATTVGADGDYHPLEVNGNGRLWTSALIDTALPAGSNVIGGVTQSGTWTVTGAGGTFPATDSGGSLTVDAPVGTPVFVRLSDGSAAITTLAGNLTQLGGTAVDANSGTKSAGTLRVVLATDQPALTNKLLVTPDARAATADAITAKLATDAVQNGLTALTPKFAAVSVNSSGDNTLVAAVTSKKIRVLAIILIPAAATNIYLTSGAGGTAIFAGSTNKANLAANSGFVLGFNPVGWFETASGVALVLNLSAGNAVGGTVVYVEV